MSMPSMKLSKNPRDFIDDEQLEKFADQQPADNKYIQDIVDKSIAKEALTVKETAALLSADAEGTEIMFSAAKTLKENVYGNRIVLFAPLYIGNMCINDCSYCGFKCSNPDVNRRTLSHEEIREQVIALEKQGHKRLILVYGEHPDYDAEFIASTVRTVYETKSEPHGEIRRVNINAAPLDISGYKTVKNAGIGTYQIFQETYHKQTYADCHPMSTRKGDYHWRLDGLDRAMEAGIDDVGIGALFGLYNWKFEVLGLVSHAVHLNQKFGVGPHTISFPRMRPACGVKIEDSSFVSDAEFIKLIATLRLAVPYTGLICTARESSDMRRIATGFGVSQIDAGSRIEIGGYTEAGDSQVMEKEQFTLGDIRSLDTVIKELLDNNYIPSFCTSCYRLGRTGEHFMEFAVPGFIKRFCTPNALCTLEEYICDYGSPKTAEAADRLITEELNNMDDSEMKDTVIKRLNAIKNEDQRDVYF